VDMMPSTAAEACALLNWSGLLVDVTVLGTRLTIAAETDQAEHADRLAGRLFPVADPLLMKCVAHSDPAFLARRSPVRIDGAIAVRRRWSSARSTLGTFTAFGGRVAVLPVDEARRTNVAVEAIVGGCGIIAERSDGDLEIVQHPGARTPQSRSWVHRLVEEIVYDAVLAGSSAGADTTAPPIRPWTSP
jgi:hypothetical protein